MPPTLTTRLYWQFILLILFIHLSTKVAYSQDNNRPNILFAISDDQSFPYASAYGSRSVETPAFDYVAKQGVLFNNAFAASPGCSPSRAAILTGKYPWELEHAGTHASYFSSEYIVFPDLLEKNGYAIGFTGKGWGPGDWAHSGRSRNPAGPAYNQHSTGTSVEGISTNDYARNFEHFLSEREEGQPFYFWYGAYEPHRVFKHGIGKEAGKKLSDAEVPSFLPDHPAFKNDILDYAYEIEHFDDHLGQMIEMLDDLGELDNTIVIVTSDNGMAFPRAKANTYEYGIHVPLAIMWPIQISADQHHDDLVSLIDLAPTILAATNTPYPPQHSMTGNNLLPVLQLLDADPQENLRTTVYSSRERHSSSRYNSLSYPQRAIRTEDYLLIRNFKPERWPAGAPQKFADDGALGPMHGGYHDIDAAPSLAYLIDNREDTEIRYYFHLSVDLRPEYELYHIQQDPGCLINLVSAPGYAPTLQTLKEQLNNFLLNTSDPRVLGNGDIFETYPRVSRLRNFPTPHWVDADNPGFRPSWLDR